MKYLRSFRDKSSLSPLPLLEMYIDESDMLFVILLCECVCVSKYNHSLDMEERTKGIGTDRYEM